MLSEREVKTVVSLAIKKYALTQANLFYLKNGIADKYESGDVQYLANLLNEMISVNAELHSNKFFSQPNYIDFYNSLIDSDKREEVRDFCLSRDAEIKIAVKKFTLKSIINLLKEDLEEISE